MFINDSTNRVKIHTYHGDDTSYLVERSQIWVEPGYMIRHKVPDKGLKLRVWWTVRGRESKILDPGKLYQDNQTVLISSTGGVTPGGELLLAGVPRRVPAPLPAGARVFADGQGLTVTDQKQQIFSPDRKYFLMLSPFGQLTFESVSPSRMLWSSGTYEKGVKYVVFSRGILYLLSDKFDVIRQFSSIAGTSSLLVGNGNLAIVKPSNFLVWSVPVSSEAFYKD